MYTCTVPRRQDQDLLPCDALRWSFLDRPGCVCSCVFQAFVDLTRDIFELVGRGDIQIQEGWEGVKSGLVPNTVHSSEEVTKGDRRCLC